MINRRDLLLGGAAGAAALGFGRVDPDFLMNSAFAAEGRTLRFLGAEALTGNWDPTTHTNLGQLIVEGFVFGYLTRAPMKPEKPDELVLRSRRQSARPGGRYRARRSDPTRRH